MPQVNTLFGGPPPGSPQFVGPGSADSTSMAAHPLVRGAVADASEMALSRTAGVIVAGAIVVIALIHLGGFKTSISVG